jgi:hypothetical protein
LLRTWAQLEEVKVSTGTLELLISRMVEHILDNGLQSIRKKSNGQDSDALSSQTALNIKEKLKKVFSMEKVEWLIQTEMSIKVNGKMAKLVVKEFSLISKDPCTREPGRMINITERVPNNGTIIKLYTLEISLMVKRQEKVNSSLMETFMKVISSMANSTEKENTTSLSQVRSMKVNSKKIICTVQVRWPGLMALTIKEVSPMERLKVKELELIQMEIKSQDNSKTIRKMDQLLSTRPPKIKKSQSNIRMMSLLRTLRVQLLQLLTWRCQMQREELLLLLKEILTKTLVHIEMDQPPSSKILLTQED